MLTFCTLAEWAAWAWENLRDSSVLWGVVRGGDGGGISFSLKAGVQGVFLEKSEHIGKSVCESGWEGLEKWEIWGWIRIEGAESSLRNRGQEKTEIGGERGSFIWKVNILTWQGCKDGELSGYTVRMDLRQLPLSGIQGLMTFSKIGHSTGFVLGLIP